MPYTFTARPWELKTTYSIDVLDGVGSNIEVNNRGGEVMRILPRLNEEINQDWISDKTRHAFDGLKKQRLSFPILKSQDGQVKELRWEEAMNLIRDKFESTCALRDLLHRLGCEKIESSSIAPKVNINLRSEYLFNSKIAGIEDTDYILMVGCNIRTEAPVLNARIRK
jgi:NADH dehydrogenase/NADH:ubiquinone oxidoreductase subunit G